MNRSIPSPVILLSAAAVVLAAVAFFVTAGHHAPQQVAIKTGVAQSPGVSPSTSPSSKPTTKHTPGPSKTVPAVDRSKVSVVVYNNTNVAGLAGKVGTRVSQAGWHFLAADNWQGTVPATTVYYGAGLKAAATQLGLDLGIKRIVPRDPAATGMLPNGLTVILVGPLG